MKSAPLPSPIKTSYRPGEITALCDAAIATASSALDRIAAMTDERKSSDTTLLACETAMAD